MATTDSESKKEHLRKMLALLTNDKEKLDNVADYYDKWSDNYDYDQVCFNCFCCYIYHGYFHSRNFKHLHVEKYN